MARALRGIRVGRIAGLEVRVDYSWFLIFFLILWSLTMAVFPARLPGNSPGTYAAMGAAGTLLFFASLLAHEICHSVVARWRGIPVEGITLFIFGGMAHTREEAEHPGDEFVIAGVGPLASLLLAALFVGVAALARALDWHRAVVEVANHLALVNVALAVFNLLPGFPLDGGRLFRAAAWKYTGDLTRATRMATTGGRWLGNILMGLGILMLFTTGAFGGLWITFIGWFVRTAANASYAQYLLLRSLEGVRARDVMATPITAVPPDLSLREFADQHILHGRHRAYPVLEDEQLRGLITLEQLRSIPQTEWPMLTVRDAMLPPDAVALADGRENMSDVLEKLTASAAGRVLVTRDGRIEGVITRGDLARWIERAQLLSR